MDRTIQLVIVLNERETRDTLSDFLNKSGIPVSETDDIQEIYALLEKKGTVPIHLSSQDSYRQHRDNIVNLASMLFPGARCILVSSDKLRRAKKSQHMPQNHIYKGMTLEEVEKDHIVRTLHVNGWQIQHAAKELGINRSTLYRKMKKYNISTN